MLEGKKPDHCSFPRKIRKDIIYVSEGACAHTCISVPVCDVNSHQRHLLCHPTRVIIMFTLEVISLHISEDLL